MKHTVSPLCFGCEPLGGQDWGNVSLSDVEDAIGQSLELGINFFDTAAVYGLGDSERRLSQALGVRRHDVIIGTKGGLDWCVPPGAERAIVFRDSSRVSLRSGVEDSLRRLRLDRLPIFYVHWPDERVGFEETFSELNDLQEKQLIVSIGVSNFSLSQIRSAVRYCRVNYLQMPINYLSYDESEEIGPYCLENDIAIVAYNVLSRGLLTGKFTENVSFPVSDRRSRLPEFQGDSFLRRLAEIRAAAAAARDRGQTLLEYAFSWVLRRPGVVSAIAGIKNSQQLVENWRAVQGVARRGDCDG